MPVGFNYSWAFNNTPTLNTTLPEGWILNASLTTDFDYLTVPTSTWYWPFSSVVDLDVDISQNSTGSAYAFACQAATVSHSDEVSSLYAAVPTIYYDTFTVTDTATAYSYDIWTTDCDGLPHARGSGPIASSTFLTTYIMENYPSTPSAQVSTPPSPTCSINEDDCATIWSSYVVESDAYASFVDAAYLSGTERMDSPSYIATGEPVIPQCKKACTYDPGSCFIEGGSVDLLYWPVLTANADECGRSGTTIANNATLGPRSVILDGSTFVSPTVYLSLSYLYATDHACGGTIGPVITRTVIPLDPSDLSSARGPHIGRQPYSFNLADLNGFVSSAAFCTEMGVGQPAPCSVILDDDYNPILWMPDAVVDLVPEWAGCKPSIFGVYDPPVALGSVAAITQAARPTPVPAVPVQQPLPPTAAQTQGSLQTDPAQTLIAPDPGPGVQPTATAGGQSGAVQGPQATGANNNDGGSTATNPWDRLASYIASIIGITAPLPAPTAGTPTNRNPQETGQGQGQGQQPLVGGTGAPGQPSQTTNGPAVNVGPPAATAAPIPIPVSLAPDGSGVVVGGSTTVPFSVFFSMQPGATAGASSGGSSAGKNGPGAAPPGTITGTAQGATGTAQGGRGTATGTGQGGGRGGGGGASTTGFAIIPTTNAAGSTGVVVGTQTIYVSGPPITVGGHTISAGPSGIVIDGSSTIQYATASTSPTESGGTRPSGLESSTSSTIGSGSGSTFPRPSRPASSTTARGHAVQQRAEDAIGTLLFAVAFHLLAHRLMG